MLVGFLAVAWLQVGVVLLVVLLVLEPLPGTVALQVAVPLVIATAGLLWWATVRALRLRRPTPAGVPVLRQHAPALWSMLDEAAAAAGVKSPDGVTVVAGAAATLSEHIRFGGLIGGRRELYLGLPLLQAWDEPRLRAAVAHELAHGSPALGGRFAPLARRGRVALGRIVPRIPSRSPAGPVLRAWSRWYLAVDAPYSRAQELAADRVAASFAGAPAAAAVLRDGPALEGMQQLFHAEYLSPGWQTGLVPDDVFGGFLRVLAARPDDMAALRAREPDQPGQWDPHPPRPDRLAALALLPATAPAPTTDGSRAASPGSATDGLHPGVPDSATAGSRAGAPGSAADGSRAGVPGSATDDFRAAVPGSAADESHGTALGYAADDSRAAPAGSGRSGGGVAGGGSGGAAVSGSAADRSRAAGEMVPDLPGLGRALQAVAYPVGGRAVVGWDEFFGVARIAEMEREADASLRALSRAAGTPVTGAAEVLDLASDGRLRKIAETVFDDLPAEDVAGRVTNLIALLLALAALHSGVARWRHSWSGTAELVAIDGSYLELQAPAEMAGDPATVTGAREWLAALGIDLTAAASTSRHHSARVPVLGGVVGVQVDGTRTDLLVLETGLFLVPALPRSRHHEAKRRLTRLATEGVLTDGSPATTPGLPIPPQPGADSHAATEPTHPTESARRAASTPTTASAEAAVSAQPAATTEATATATLPDPTAAPGAAPAAGVAGAATVAEPAATASPMTMGETGSRFVPFADVSTASATRNGRRAWAINLRDGKTLTVRTTLDSEELPGGWAALDDAVAFLTRTR